MKSRSVGRSRRRGGSRVIRAAITVLALVAATMLPRISSRYDASEDGFSATRATDDLRALAAQPRPARSPANEATRSAILARLHELGLEGTVQSTADGLSNVLGRLPGGTASTGTLLLGAHYDTVPGSPGAADDGVGVVVLLEVARVLARASERRNDVLFLFTDGEELGMRGARAFVRDHPLAGDVAAVINLEAIGNAGRAVLFGAGPGSGHVVEAFGDVPPFGDSMSELIFAALPNDTDYTVFRRRDVPGVNLALVEGAQVYHAPDDVPSAVRRASVQHIGDVTLAATRRLVDADLTRRSPSRAYRDLFGLRFLTWPITASRLGGAALVVLLLVSFLRSGVAPTRQLGEAGESAFLLVGVALVAAVTMQVPLALAALAGKGWWAPRGDETSAAVALGGQLLVALALVARSPDALVRGALRLGAASIAFTTVWFPGAVHTLAIPLVVLWLTHREGREARSAPTLLDSLAIALALLVLAPVLVQVNAAAHVRAPSGAVAGGTSATLLALTCSRLVSDWTPRASAIAFLLGTMVLTAWAVAA